MTSRFCLFIWEDRHVSRETKPKMTNKIINTKDYLVTGESFKIALDQQTGVLKTMPAPNPESLKKYYQTQQYISYTSNPKTTLEKAYVFVRKIRIAKKIKTIKKLLNKGGSLLDFGCGTGDFLLKAMEAGLVVAGIEPDKKARESAAVKTRSRIYRSKEHAGADSNKYDVITLWHSLEHVLDLEPTIVFLKNKLKPGGKILVAVPNHKSYDAKHYKEKWAAYDTPRHIWHFDQTSIEKIFNVYGFELIKKKRSFWDAFYVSILSEKYKKSAVPYIKGATIGKLSNFLSFFSGESSAITYVFSRASKK